MGKKNLKSHIDVIETMRKAILKNNPVTKVKVDAKKGTITIPKALLDKPVPIWWKLLHQV